MADQIHDIIFKELESINGKLDDVLAIKAKVDSHEADLSGRDGLVRTVERHNEKLNTGNRSERLSAIAAVAAVVISIIVCLLTSCSFYKGRVVGTMEQSGMEILGKRVYGSEKRIETKEEALEKIEIETIERESVYDIESKEKRRRVLLWASGVSFLVAVLGVIFGALTQGWKIGATLAAGGIALGMVFLSLIGLITTVTWILGGALVVLVARFLYTKKEKGWKNDKTKH